MIIIFSIFLTTVITNSQGKNIELLSKEEFQDKPARRAGEGDDSNADISNRNDKSHIPDIDLALTDDLPSYTGVRRENYAYNTNLNETILIIHDDSVTIDNINKNTTKEEKMNQEKHTPESYFSNATLAETSAILSIIQTNTDHKPAKNIETQTHDHYSETHVPENNSISYNFQSISKVTESYIHDSSNGTITDESTNDSAIDTTTKENADVFDILDTQIFTTTTQNTARVNTTIVEDYVAFTEISSTNEHLETIIETTTFLPALTPTIEEVLRTKNPKKITNTDIDAINKIENITNPERCVYCYRVYEILGSTKRENQPFHRSQEPIKDQANFIPVYKYSRNFAHYNLKDRLGPDEVVVNTRQYRKTNNDIDTAEASKLLTEFNNESRKFVFLKNRNERPKTSDKLPVQYERQGSNKKKLQGVKNKARQGVNSFIFDDTNIDILPELMRAILDSKSVNVTTIDSNKGLFDIDKYARLDNLFDFITGPGDIAVFHNTKIRKMSNSVSKINIYMNVLKDMILKDSNALKQYDWLATTVQIQSAITKILKLINHMRQSEPIHPADLQILKYIVFLHNFSLAVKEDNHLDNKLKKRMKLLPRNKKKRKNQLLKDIGLINTVWSNLRKLLLDQVEEDEFSHLYKFLIGVQDGLFGLHEAIRHIADVTKFDCQNWYGNLKQLYLSVDKKHLRELLLHISVSRLVDLVEHSCKQWLNYDVIQYLQTHEKEDKQIVAEMLFIGKIVDKI